MIEDEIAWWGLAGAAVCIFRFLPPPAVRGAPTRTGQDVTVKVDVGAEVGELYNSWSTSVQTIQSHFADRKNCRQIRAQHPFVRYINGVRFLGGRYGKKDDFFRGTGDDGLALCDFSESL